MKYILDTEAIGASFLVTTEPTEKTDNNGRAKADRDTGEFLYVTELLVREQGESRSELIRVTTAGRPNVNQDQSVVPVALEALYWTNTGNDGKTRSGIAYRAKSIEVSGSKSAGADKSEKAADKPVKAVAS